MLLLKLVILLSSLSYFFHSPSLPFFRFPLFLFPLPSFLLPLPSFLLPLPYSALPIFRCFIFSVSLHPPPPSPFLCLSRFPPSIFPLSLWGDLVYLPFNSTP